MMALIKCPDCGKEISAKAATCISCGAPIATAADAKSGVPTTTIQQTSKRLKMLQILSVLVIIVGGVMLSVQLGANETEGNGGAVMTIGVLSYFIVRFLTWWHHK